jgi:predicted nucleic acid-binding protein
MSRACFLDTSGWYAVLRERDEHHQAAQSCYQGELQGGTRFLTTNLVLAEMHALIIRHRDAAYALRFLDTIRRDPIHSVIYSDSDLEREAVDRWLRPFADKRFSLADAVSFEVMRREQVTVALAVDNDFRAAGFEVIP